MTLRGNHPGLGGLPDGVESLWTPGNHSAPSQRRMTNWPLEPIAMDIPVQEADLAPGSEWPPTRGKRLYDRYNVQNRVARGDLRDFVADVSAVRILPNYFARSSEVLSRLMVSTDPPEDIAEAVGQSTLHVFQHGRSYYANLGGDLTAWDPIYCWRHADAETLYIVYPFVSVNSDDGNPDRVMVHTIPRQGTAVTETAEWSGTHIGDYSDIQEADEGSGWSYADNFPRIDGHGKSSMDDLIPLVFALAARFTGVDHVTSAHQAPTLLLPIPFANVKKVVIPDATPHFDPDTLTFRQAQQLLQDGFAQNDVLWTPDGVNAEGAKYLTWDGALSASFSQIDRLKAEVRAMNGIAAALEQEGGDVPSGAALAMMNMTLYWMAQMFYVEENRAIGEALGRETGWDNWFNIEDPTPSEPPDVLTA